MDGRVNMTVRYPGDMTGKKPRRIEGERRCPCGTKLMPYNLESLCSICQRTPRPAKEIVMHPEEWTAKQVKEYLGLGAIGDVRTVEDEGHITLVATGRGRWGRKYDSDSVRAYHDKVTLEKFADEAFVAAREAVQDRPDCPIAEPGEMNCCGKPDDCEVLAEPEDCCTEPEIRSGVSFAGPMWLGPALDIDPEIEAMDAIRQALESLDNEQRIRAVEWAIQRFEIRRSTPA